MQLAIHSPETEKALLGQILVDNDVIDKVGGFIPEPDVFYSDVNRQVWEAMTSMRRNGEGIIDIVLYYQSLSLMTIKLQVFI